MNPHLQSLEAELAKHPIGSVNWLAILAEIVALLNQVLNPPAPPAA
jgi:hypothetical protein